MPRVELCEDAARLALARKMTTQIVSDVCWLQRDWVKQRQYVVAPYPDGLESYLRTGGLSGFDDALESLGVSEYWACEPDRKRFYLLQGRGALSDLMRSEDWFPLDFVLFDEHGKFALVTISGDLFAAASSKDAIEMMFSKPIDAIRSEYLEMTGPPTGSDYWTILSEFGKDAESISA